MPPPAPTCRHNWDRQQHQKRSSGTPGAARPIKRPPAAMHTPASRDAASNIRQATNNAASAKKPGYIKGAAAPTGSVRSSTISSYVSRHANKIPLPSPMCAAPPADHQMPAMHRAGIAAPAPPPGIQLDHVDTLHRAVFQRLAVPTTIAAAQHQHPLRPTLAQQCRMHQRFGDNENSSASVLLISTPSRRKQPAECWES